MPVVVSDARVGGTTNWLIVRLESGHLQAWLVDYDRWRDEDWDPNRVVAAAQRGEAHPLLWADQGAGYFLDRIVTDWSAAVLRNAPGDCPSHPEGFTGTLTAGCTCFERRVRSAFVPASQVSRVVAEARETGDFQGGIDKLAQLLLGSHEEELPSEITALILPLPGKEPKA